MRRKRERKERVIHARVPESLDEEIKRKADGLGLSVSNLVRSVLENTFGLVEDIVTDSANVARAVRGEPAVERRGPPKDDDADDVLGWQEAVLAVNAVCVDCNDILPRGTKAAIGVASRPGAPRQFLCLTCLQEEMRDDDEPAPDPESAQ
jgi:hypothetical protein